MNDTLMEPASPPGRCKSCKAPIFWARTDNDRAIPLDPQQRLDGNVVLFGEGECRVVKAGEGRYVTHFTSCPKASSHRGRKAGG